MPDPSPPFFLRLFGAPAVEYPGEVVTGFRSWRALALLAYLVFQALPDGRGPARPVSRSELVELIWPDRDESQGRSNLRWALSWLAGLLPGAVMRTRTTAWFVLPPGCRVDLYELAAAIERPQELSPERFQAVWRGELLQGVYGDSSAEFETWLLTQRESWRLRVLETLAALVAAHEQAGAYEVALQFAGQWLALEPWAEEGYRHTMRLLVRMGRPEAALEQFERCRRILAEELGTEPGAETVQLFQRVQAGLQQPRHNLPSQPTPFIGRSRLLQTVSQLLGQPQVRLVTLFAPPGMGKTRLAQEAARQVAGHFVDGAWLVSLENVTSADGAVSAIAAALAVGGIRDDAGTTSPSTPLVRLLARRELLLVLDNLDHPEAITPLLSALMRQIPGVRLLVTAHERLHLQWEHAVEVDGLGQEAAVQLFCRVAERYKPDCRPDAEDLRCIEEIFRMVGGMPLALELAAAWVRMQSCRAIADALRHNLHMLASDEPDRPDRQRSIDVALDHTWHSLEPMAQQIIARLACFAGGFTSEAAEKVADAGWRHLAPLIDRALLQQNLDPAGNAPVRYTIHPLLRRYALEQISAEALHGNRNRHSHYYAGLLQRHTAALQNGTDAAIATIQREAENIRLAWEWAVDQELVGDIATGFEGLAYFCDMSCQWREGLAWFSAAAVMLRRFNSPFEGLTQMARVVEIGVLIGQANFLSRLGRNGQAREILHQSLAAIERTGYEPALPLAHFLLGRCCTSLADYSAAIEHLQQSAELCRQAEDERGVARALVNLSGLLVSTGNYAEAEATVMESEKLFSRSGDQRGQAVASLTRARVALAAGFPGIGRLHLDQCRRHMQGAGGRSLLAEVDRYAGVAAWLEHDRDRARELLTMAAETLRDLGEDDSLITVLHLLVTLALQQGQTAEAQELLAELLALQNGSRHTARVVALLTAQGEWLLAMGREHEARHILGQALERSDQAGMLPRKLTVLAVLARLEALAGNGEKSAELVTLIRHHPATHALTRHLLG
jgi:DNA-binding SARP family transcriptional activator/predicted ATPase